FNGRRVKLVADYFGNITSTYSNYSGGYQDETSSLFGVFGRQYRYVPPKGAAYKDSTIYDSFGRVWKKSSPDEGWKEFYYDKAGKLRLAKDTAGTWTYFKYDGLGRLTEQGVVSTVNDPSVTWTDHTFPTSGTSQIVTRRYDVYADSVDNYANGSYMLYPKGRLTEVYDPTGYNFFFYDQRGRVAKKVSFITGESRPRSHVYAYTAGDLLDSLYYPTYAEVADSIRDAVKYTYYEY